VKIQGLISAPRPIMHAATPAPPPPPPPPMCAAQSSQLMTSPLPMSGMPTPSAAAAQRAM
jgi:hypothetical protein